MSQLAMTNNRPPTVRDLLEENLRQAKDVLPACLNPERMTRLALRTIRCSPKLQQCNPYSLVACIMEAGALGLEIDARGLAYLVPYKNEVKLMVGYKGMMELAYRSGEIQNIYGEIVCKNDYFEYEMGLEPKLKHRPAMGDRGEMTGCYAVAKMKNGESHFLVMSRSEVEEIKRSSKAQSPESPWNLWFNEMAKKSVIRRLCKYLPLSADVQIAIAVDELGERGESQHVADYDLIDAPAPKSVTEKLSEAMENPVPEKKSAPAKAERSPTSATQPATKKGRKSHQEAEPPVTNMSPDGAPKPEPEKDTEGSLKIDALDAEFSSVLADHGIPLQRGRELANMLSSSRGITLAHAMTMMMNDQNSLREMYEQVFNEKLP